MDERLTAEKTVPAVRDALGQPWHRCSSISITRPSGQVVVPGSGPATGAIGTRHVLPAVRVVLVRLKSRFVPRVGLASRRNRPMTRVDLAVTAPGAVTSTA
jgi:hypothetical protein